MADLPARPIDASVSVVFNSGGLTGTNAFTVYFREAVVDYITMLEMNQYTMAELNGRPVPNQGDAKWEPRNISTLEGLDVVDIEGITMRDLERTEDFDLLSNFRITVEWGSTPGTSIYGLDSEGNGQSFLDVGDLTASTVYVALLDVYDNSWRARIYPTAAGVIDKTTLIYDTGEVNDDFHLKRRKGTLRLAENLMDGTADVIEMRTRHLNFAEYRSQPMRSHTPVEGCQIFAESTPGVENFEGLVDGPSGGTFATDRSKSLSGESYKITNLGQNPNQGVQTNLIEFENWDDYRIEFDIYYPQEEIDNDNPVKFFLCTPTGGVDSAPMTATAASDLITLNSHGYVNNQIVELVAATGAAPLVPGTKYWVRDVTTNTFKLAASYGGAAINITSNGTNLYFNTGLVPINVGRIQGDSWYHVKLYPVEGNVLLTGQYSLVWQQPGTGRASTWWLDNIRVIEESMRWDARAVTDDPWGDRKGAWTRARDLINSEHDGLLFQERGNTLQVRGKALRQDTTLGKVKIRPKYAELGRVIFEENESRTDLLAAETWAPLVASTDTTDLGSNKKLDRIHIDHGQIPSGAGAITGMIRFEGSTDNVTYFTLGSHIIDRTGWHTYEFTSQPNVRYFRITATGSANFTIYDAILRPYLEAPVADFTPNVVGDTVTFDGGTSTDADGFIIAYLWNFGDGAQGFGENTVHTYDETGVGYNVTLMVIDNHGNEGIYTEEVGV